MRVQQLCLSEIDPDAVHGYDGVRGCSTGYRGRCLCGFVSDELGSRRLAHGAVSSHLSRTPAGLRLMETLRKPRQHGE